jgi:uncharacterized protein
MEALDWSVDKSVKIGMVQAIEQAERLTDEFEPLMVSDEKMSLPGFIEGEVLISLPDFPRHAHKCLHYEPAVKLAEPKIIKQEPDNLYSL